jgi:hypothetical protein
MRVQVHAPKVIWNPKPMLEQTLTYSAFDEWKRKSKVLDLTEHFPMESATPRILNLVTR